MTAADFDFNLTRVQIIEAALRKVRGLSQGEVLSAYKKTNSLQALNVMVKSWQNKGVYLWTEKLFSFATVANQNNYDLDTISTDENILSIESGFIRDAGIDVPLTLKSWKDYQVLANKSDVGEPRFVTQDRLSREAVFYLTPDKVYTAFLFTIVKLKDFDSDATQGDFETHWLEALIFGLASKLMFEFPVPPNEKREIQGAADTAFLQAKNTEDRSNSDYKHAESAFPRGSFK